MKDSAESGAGEVSVFDDAVGSGVKNLLVFNHHREEFQQFVCRQQRWYHQEHGQRQQLSFVDSDLQADSYLVRICSPLLVAQCIRVDKLDYEPAAIGIRYWSLRLRVVVFIYLVEVVFAATTFLIQSEDDWVSMLKTSLPYFQVSVSSVLHN